MKDTINQNLKMLDVVINGCHKRWLKVDFRYHSKQFSGWLHELDSCPNPFTTCS